MITQIAAQNIPQTLAEFLRFDPEDGFKYEWNDGELIKFEGLKKKEYYIYTVLNDLFYTKGYNQLGSLIGEADVMLTGIQMRRPDVAYFTREQVYAGKEGEDVIPAFVIEIISPTDDAERIEDKLKEYFKAGVAVVWHVFPSSEVVYVFNGRKNVTVCTDDDICSASPVLDGFEISVKNLLLI